MKKGLLYIFLLVAAFGLAASAMAQNPTPKVYAYSRERTSGIPGGPPNNSETKKNSSPLPTEYFIYLEVGKDSKPSISTIWLNGKYYKVTLQKLSTPVLLDNDVASIKKHKDTLIKKTSNDVYRILPGSPANPPSGVKADDVKDYVVVAFVTVNKITYTEAVKSFKQLKPLAGM